MTADDQAKSAAASSKPRVAVIMLGGTISMLPGAGSGVVPALSGAQLIDGVATVGDVADIEVETPVRAASASLAFSDILHVARRITALETQGVYGVVVIQGTDTIDETSFLLDLWTAQLTIPIVVTGAMRSPSQPGADGPANIISAVRVAASPHAAGLGVLVVLNDEVHTARHVEKLHTALPSAFRSLDGGVVGHLVEGQFRLRSRPAQPVPAMIHSEPAPIAIVKITLGDDGRLCNVIQQFGYAGAVVEAMGGGHVPEAAAGAIKALARSVPVVLCSRVRGGPVLTQTYGFAGSEIDLLDAGLIPAGLLSPQKARLLLGLCIASGETRAGIAATFGAMN